MIERLKQMRNKKQERQRIKADIERLKQMRNKKQERQRIKADIEEWTDAPLKKLSHMQAIEDGDQEYRQSFLDTDAPLNPYNPIFQATYTSLTKPVGGDIAPEQTENDETDEIVEDERLTGAALESLKKIEKSGLRVTDYEWTGEWAGRPGLTVYLSDESRAIIRPDGTIRFLYEGY